MGLEVVPSERRTCTLTKLSARTPGSTLANYPSLSFCPSNLWGRGSCPWQWNKCVRRSVASEFWLKPPVTDWAPGQPAIRCTRIEFLVSKCRPWVYGAAAENSLCRAWWLTIWRGRTVWIVSRNREFLGNRPSGVGLRSVYSYRGIGNRNRYIYPGST